MPSGHVGNAEAARMATLVSGTAGGTIGAGKSDTMDIKTMANTDAIKWAIGVTDTNAATIGATVVD
jgi:hypothetical protein